MESRYVLQSEEALSLAIKSLEGKYRDTKAEHKVEPNPIRLKQITALKALLPLPAHYPHHREILTGACWCVSEYLGSRSVLAQHLLKALNVNDEEKPNSLDVFTKFITGTLFYEYAKECMPLEMREPLKAIVLRAKSAIAPELRLIFKRLLTPEALHEGLENLRSEYLKLCKNDSAFYKALSYLSITGHSPSRLDQIEFLELVRSGRYTNNDLPLTAAQLEANRYHLELGTVLSTQIILSVEYTVLSPERSYLYTALSKLSNIQSLADIDNKVLKNEISQVMAYISSLACKCAQREFDWEKVGLSQNQIESVQDQITDVLALLKNSSQTNFANNDKLNTAIDTLCTFIVTNGMKGAIAFGLAELFSLLVFNGLSIQTACLLLNPTYAALAVSAVVMMASLYGPVETYYATKIASSVKPAVNGAVQAVINTAYYVSQLFFAERPAVKDVALHEELARALMRSNLDICSKEEKDKLRLLFERDVFAPPLDNTLQRRMEGEALLNEIKSVIAPPPTP